MAYPEYAGGEQTLVTLGDVAVTPSWVITPSGSAPVGQTTFTLTDLSMTTRAIPTWAIVCAVVFSPAQVYDMNARVNYARSVAHGAG